MPSGIISSKIQIMEYRYSSLVIQGFPPRVSWLACLTIVMLCGQLAIAQSTPGAKVIALPNPADNPAITQPATEVFLPGVDPAQLERLRTRQTQQPQPPPCENENEVCALPTPAGPDAGTATVSYLDGVGPALIKKYQRAKESDQSIPLETNGPVIARPESGSARPEAGKMVPVDGTDPGLLERYRKPIPNRNGIPFKNDGSVLGLPRAVQASPAGPIRRVPGSGALPTGSDAESAKNGPVTNRPPVAVPDVYTTPFGEPLVLEAPGHLANDTDPEGDELSWTSYQVPTNGMISAATPDGGFTYTPDPGFSGIETIEVTITDGQGNLATGLVIILVEANFGPQVVPDVYTTPQGEPLVVNAPGHLANDFDPEGDELSWTSYQVPANGQISGTMTDGSFTYTPAPGFSGIETIEVAVVDGQGNFAFGLVVIYVEQNYAPEAVPDVYTTPFGEPLVLTAPGHLANDTDPEGDELSWISYQVPTNGQISGTDAEGSFTYTPAPGFSGIETFAVTIIDGQGNFSTGLITITVLPASKNELVAVPDNYTTPKGVPLVVSAPGHLENDFDPEGDELSWTSYQVPANGQISGTRADGSFTYTPDPGFSGIETFEVTITDGQGNFAIGQITIYVEANYAPEAVPDVYTTPFGEPLVLAAPGHLANDTDPEGDELSWTSYQVPANGQISGTEADGSFTYTPDPGFSGIETFTVTIVDGQGNFAVGQITIYVEENYPPEIVPDVYITREEMPLVVSAPGHLANDTDPEGDELSWTSYQVPANGQISGAEADGSFTYTPDPGFSGIESFEVAVVDGKGNTGFGLVAILVLDNAPPVADAGPDQTIIAGLPVTLDGSGSYDPDGDPITYSWVFATPDASAALPAGSGALLFDANTVSPSFTPDLPGDYTVELIVNDGIDDSAPDYVTVTALSIAEALDQFQADLEGLAASGVLNKGQLKAVTALIARAQRFLDRGQTQQALNILGALRQQILAWLAAGILTQEQADMLLAQLDAIEMAIQVEQITALGQDAALLKGKPSSYSPAGIGSLRSYPNPFRTTTQLVFDLPEPANVRVEVYDAFGRSVTVLSNAYRDAGRHEVRFEAGRLAGGAYTVRVTTDNGQVASRRVVLVR